MKEGTTLAVVEDDPEIRALVGGFLEGEGFTLSAAAAFLAVGPVQALPVWPAPTDAPPVMQVRGGCGYGEHRGPLAGCRLNRGPRGAIRRAITGVRAVARPEWFEARAAPATAEADR